MCVCVIYIIYTQKKSIYKKNSKKKNLLQSNQNTIHPYFYS